MQKLKLGDKRWATISNQEEIYKQCPECGEKYWSLCSKDYPLCKSCGIKVGKTYIGQEGHPYIRLAETDPYYSMTVSKSLMGNGWVRVSRYTLAQSLGRCLTESEQVWHQDKDNQNNKLENLILRTVGRKREETEEETRKTRNYKFGYEQGYEVGYEEGFCEGEKFKRRGVERKVASD